MHTLIVIDDERATLDGLVGFIDWQSVGFEVVGAFEDGREAIDFLDRSMVDVVLTDIRMAERSGLDVAEYLWTKQRRERVVVVTAYARFEYAQRALRFHIVDYLLKPIDLGALQSLFRSLAADLDREILDRSVEAIGSMDREAFFRELEQCSRAELRDIQQILDRMYASSARKDANLSTDYSSLIVQRALQFIESNYSRDVTLDEIAEFCHLSPAYFSRVLKKKTGLTFKQSITMVRLRRARALLIETNMKIKDIGNEVGFPNEVYFARVFRRANGTSPLAFRHLSLSMPS